MEGRHRLIWSNVASASSPASGVAILVKRKWTSGIKKVICLNDRVMALDLKIFQKTIRFISIYVPHSGYYQVFPLYVNGHRRSGHGCNRQRISNDIGRRFQSESKSRVSRASNGRIMLSILIGYCKWGIDGKRSEHVDNGNHQMENITDWIIFFIPDPYDMLILQAIWN